MMNYWGILSAILLELLAVFTLNTCKSDSPDNPAATEYSRADSANINFESPQFRVLDIGNSYTRNCTDYLPHIMASMRLDCSDISLYRAIFGGGTFKNWVDVYNGDETLHEYYIEWVLGDVKCDSFKNYGVYKGPEGLRTLLNDYDWDLIIIHQASRYATDYDSWTSHSEAGYLDELIDIIKVSQPEVPLGTYIIHSYGDESKYNTEKMTSSERWSCIAASTKRMQEDYGIDLLIPYGTAIELLRSTPLNNSKDLLADGTHLSPGIAQYTAACCYYEAVFAPRFKKSMIGNIYHPNGHPSVTDTNVATAQQFARRAYEQPFKIREEDE
ncbi:MAG: DUF4886 domain-containing protein [Muribaculaceae bacterium]|nr:DUF4886 domain-containing protein [Muribaculaceae bacterium]